MTHDSDGRDHHARNPPVRSEEALTRSEEALTRSGEALSPAEKALPPSELVARSVRGDARALAVLCDLLRPLIVKSVKAKLGRRPPEDVEEVVQRTYIALLEKFRSPSEAGAIDSIFGYARGIAFNQARQFLDSQGRLPRVLGEDQLPEMIETKPGPERVLSEKELYERVRQRLDAEMSARERECFHLRFVEELSPGETAKVMHTSRGNVDQMVHRIRRRADEILSIVMKQLSGKPPVRRESLKDPSGEEDI